MLKPFGNIFKYGVEDGYIKEELEMRIPWRAMKQIAMETPSLYVAIVCGRAVLFGARDVR